MKRMEVGIIGAGISGLTAADWLSAAGCNVTILEARERAGGRIHTLHAASLPRPIEFGAEFLHGDRQETWKMARHCPGFRPTEFPDRHWEFLDGELVENKEFWDDLGEVMEKLGKEKHDESFAAFLQK